MNKLPKITLAFWVMKICATTLGETAGDLISMTLNVGYAVSTIILISVFLAFLFTQLKAKKFHPSLYWGVILATSTAGTTMSDFMDRTLKLGYLNGSLILISLLLIIFFIWKKTTGTISVEKIDNPKSELFYWTSILISNTLGTALGDFLADSSGLGFAGGASLIGSLILLTILANFYTKISKIALFWIAFVLTRPFGATIGDLLTKTKDKGGIGLGTTGSSIMLFAVLIVLVFFSHAKKEELILD